MKQPKSRLNADSGLRQLPDLTPRLSGDDASAADLATTLLSRPGFTLRGGTNQILRGVIARGLGLR